MSYYVNPHEHSCPWFPYTELLGSTGSNYCEATKCQWISQPINSYSGLSFLVIGLLLIFSLLRRDSKVLQESIVFICLTGVSFYLYHMSLTYAFYLVSQILIATLFSYNIADRLESLERINSNQKLTLLFGLPLLIAVIDFGLHKFFITTNWLMPIFIISSLLVFYSLDKESKKYPLYISGAFVLLSYFTQILETTRFFCDPFNKYFQVQALANVFMALSLGGFYFYIFQFFKVRKINFNIQIGAPSNEDITGEIDLAEFQEMKRLAKKLEEHEKKSEFFLEPEPEEVDDSQLQMVFEESEKKEEDS